jgi:S-adenosyl-L-methionine hydrolase (adenosine-forming)
MQTITLTTDFGRPDWFVGTMKGVILGIRPGAVIVDISHEISFGDIRSAAFALMASCRYFPKGTIHVAIVDPGVGSARKAIAVKTADYFLVGPDNGVLSFALRREKIKAVHRLENSKYFLRPVSRTFHGRDIFAPVAAHLSRGVSIGKLGPAQSDLIRLDWPEVKARMNRIEGEVIYVDRFGNAITNIENRRLNSSNRPEVFSGRKRLCPVKAYYQSVPVGDAVAVPGSTGFLEICINGGSAARKLKLKTGKHVTVCFS